MRQLSVYDTEIIPYLAFGTGTASVFGALSLHSTFLPWSQGLLQVFAQSLLAPVFADLLQHDLAGD